MVDLSSAKAKLGRAKLHIAAAKNAAKGFVDADLYKARVEKDAKGRSIVKVTDLKAWPNDFVLAVGDAAHNLRSALDHIIFALARKPLTSDEERRIQFPLVSKRKNYRVQRDRFLPKAKIPRNVRALVNAFQPYHRKKGPENTFLEQLQAISNWDKHRSLPIAAPHVKRISVSLEVISGHFDVVSQTFHVGPIKVGTIIARFEVKNVAPNTKVKMNSKTVVIPVFYEGMPKEIINLSVINRLNKISGFIENNLLPKFEALG